MLGGEALLQGVPEEEVSLQKLLHELHVRLTGAQRESFEEIQEGTNTTSKHQVAAKLFQ